MGHSETRMESFLYSLHNGTVLIDRYYTPFLCLIGAIGNSLSVLVFCLDSKYRSQSASYYLSALALSDTGYLINLFVVWLEGVRELVITSDFICPMVMYLGQVTTFLSIYLIVAFSVERYVVVHYPLSRARICTRSKARKIITGLTAISLVIYSYAWIIARVVEVPSYEKFGEVLEEENEYSAKNSDAINGSLRNEWTVAYRCSVPEEYNYISEIANYIDTCLTFIIPFILISFLNGRIAWSLWKMRDITREMTVTKNSTSPTSTPSIGSVQTTLRTSRHVRWRVLSFLRWVTGKRERSAVVTRASSTRENGESLEMTEVTAVAVVVTTTEGCKVDEKTGDDDDDEDVGAATDKQVSPQRGISGPGASGILSQTEIQIVQPCHLRKHQTVALSSSSEIRVTKTLLLVSFVFLILHLPLHVIRCSQFIQTQLLADSNESSRDDEEPQHDYLDILLPIAILWANMLFNTNFAVNFLLYCANGRNFRTTLRKILTHRILRRNETLQSSILNHTPKNARHPFTRRPVSGSATQED